VLDSLANFSFHISTSWILLGALAVIAVITALIVYRRTNPPVSRGLAGLLAALRALALLLLLLAVFESRFTFSWTERKPPLIAVAIDHSASMAVQDPDGPRLNQLQRALQQDLKKIISADFARQYFQFDGAVRSMGEARFDSLNLSGDATNISLALQSISAQLREQNLTAILLFSDGNYNQGGDPSRSAEALDVPIYTVGVGSTQQPADLSITAVDANPFAYTDENTPIQVSISSVGIENAKPTLSLVEGGQVVVSTPLSVSKSPNQQTVLLNWTAKSEGRKKLTVQVSQVSGELARENNSRTLYIDVLKSRLLVTLLAGCVSPDIAFFTNALAADTRYRLQVLVQRNDGLLYTRDNRSSRLDSLDQTDLLVLMNFPTSRTNEAYLEQVEKSLASYARPVLLLTGAETAFDKMARWQRWLAIRTETLQVGDFPASISLSAEGLNHPIMQIPASSAGTASAWNLLPPIWVHHRIKSVRPGGQVLATVRSSSEANQEPWPFIVVLSDGLVHSAAILGSSLWRWSLMMKGIGNEDGLYDAFINNLLRWLQLEQKKELVNLTLNKSSYRFGEPVLVQVKLFDARLNPVIGAMVAVQLKTANEQKNLLAAEVGNGTYELTLNPETPGDYEIQVMAQKEGHPLGTSHSLFSVGEYSEELSVQICQKEMLQTLASISGGRYIPVDSLASWQGVLPKQSLSQVRHRHFNLWNHGLVLLMIIACLAAEWWLRKWKGMV